MDLNIQDLTWIDLALRQFENNNPDILAKCKTFDATKEKVVEMLTNEAFRLVCDQ